MLLHVGTPGGFRLDFVVAHVADAQEKVRARAPQCAQRRRGRPVPAQIAGDAKPKDLAPAAPPLVPAWR